jgi:tetratricopeptide (TPR) repeat protein
MDLTAVGTYHLYAGQVDLAGPLLQEGLELIRSIRGEDNLTTATAAVAYADWLVVEGRGEEAVELARQALEVRMESLAEDDAAVGIARSTLGAALTVVGAPAARAELDRAGRILEAALPEADPARVRHAGRVRAFEASRVPGGQ